MKTLTEADHGTTVTLRPSEQIEIRLPENPTTGFRWGFDELGDSSALKLVMNEYEPASGSAIGGGGQRVFVFEGARSGSTRLLFKNWREWLGESSARQWYEVIINVSG